MGLNEFDMLLSSLIYIKNSTGPNKEPWGTPLVTGSGWEIDLPIFADYVLSLR